MKPLRILALLLLGITAWTANGGWSPSAAHAQAMPLLPSPPPLLSPSGVQPVGYYSDPLSAPAEVPPGAASPQPEVRSDLNDALHAPGCDGCDSCDMCCDNGCNRRWFAIGSGLVMTRNRAPAHWTTYANGDPFNVVMNTQNAAAGWTGGGQFTVGYAFGKPGGPALALTYWALAPMNGSFTVTDQTGVFATALNGYLNWSAVTLNGIPASTFFNNSSIQNMARTDHVQNFEVNFLTTTYTMRNFQFAGIAGFRYFQFNEELTYGGASFGNTFSSNGGADAAYFNIATTNNLYGGQLGAMMNTVMTDQLTAFAIVKVGLFANSMTNLSTVYQGNLPNAPVFITDNIKSDFSGLSELDMGFNWAFAPAWQFSFGYRVVSIANLQLSDNQFATFNHVEQNGDVILHGAFFGLTWLF